MDPFDYAQLEDALDYLYDFLDQDLADRVRAEREFVPAGLEGLLADLSLIHISEPTRPCGTSRMPSSA